MDPILLLGTIGIPLALGVGGLVAWRATRAQQQRETEPATWRDDSLDDWRRERDAAYAAERERRAQHAPGADPADVPTTESREGHEGPRTHWCCPG